jgi:hypothetical protein
LTGSGALGHHPIWRKFGEFARCASRIRQQQGFLSPSSHHAGDPSPTLCLSLLGALGICASPNTGIQGLRHGLGRPSPTSSELPIVRGAQGPRPPGFGHECKEVVSAMSARKWQLLTSDWFERQERALAALTAPYFTKVFSDMHLSENWEPVIPHQYLKVSPSYAPSYSGTQAPPSSTGDTKVHQIWHPTADKPSKIQIMTPAATTPSGHAISTCRTSRRRRRTIISTFRRYATGTPKMSPTMSVASTTPTANIMQITRSSRWERDNV